MKMELIAALLHSPEVLFLDEPTIGLDVIAQHNIQAFLRHYQQVRQMTILLTSHYMKDVVALCRRVVIIAQGRIIYDGSLSGIIDRFSSHKIVSLLMLDGETAGRPGALRRDVDEQSRRGSSCGSTAASCPRCSPTSWPTTRGRRERRRSAAGGGDRRDVFDGNGEKRSRGQRNRTSAIVKRSASKYEVTVSDARSGQR